MSDNRFNESDYMISDKTIKYVEDYYDGGISYDTGFSISKGGTWIETINLNNEIYENGTREVDPIYNDKNAELQIHCFGDSWTYGWDVEQKETFVHLLGDENTSVWNYGAGKTGLDWAVKKITEVYHNFNHKENQNFIYVITVPHSF